MVDDALVQGLLYVDGNVSNVRDVCTRFARRLSFICGRSWRLDAFARLLLLGFSSSSIFVSFIYYYNQVIIFIFIIYISIVSSNLFISYYSNLCVFDYLSSIAYN